MTSETEAIKTNEFLRRRKLRLQQVREQSKDIAKKIRQRAKAEKLRQVVDLDANKQKEYFECQEKLVKRLEVLYARGLENVGAGHQSASEVTQQDGVVKTDLSKLRGKEATAELRRKKQEKLDQQKKLLDRKLQAREVANEISRDKSSVVANKLLAKSTGNKVCEDTSKKTESSTELADTKESNNELEPVKTIDMATQWDMETMPNEWEPAVPSLSLPTDKDTPKESEDNGGSKTAKSKRLDLFALSNEMPSSLRGKHTHETRERDATRPSLTLVSEYLQNRKLRLRETETAKTHQKPAEDMHSLKQTIQHTRNSKPEGSPFSVCHVLDEQVIPVPTWRAERNCQICSHSAYNHTPVPSRQFKSITNSQINQIFSSIRPLRQSDLLPSPVLRGTSPFRRSKVGPRIFSGKTTVTHDKVKNTQENTLHRKNSVQIYNHSTRDTRDFPADDSKLVVRDLQSEEDAYSQAMKEVITIGPKAKEHQKKVQDMRNKVAVTKQNVEKEYKDTMNFLNSLPKDKSSKIIKTAYMDERRQLMQQENRQQKMQQEYRKIEKECKRHPHHINKSQSLSKSPPKRDLEDNFDSRDFQYSWMPVPESDENLAIHAIPNSVKRGKSGNSVKFSKVDSYHEYRSRHKHTPPTKDTTQDKQPNKKVVEAVIIEKNTSESSDSSSSTSDTSSIENLRLDKNTKSKNVTEINKNLSDAERIIIYKILDSKSNKKTKRQTKLLNEIAKSLTFIEKGQKTVVVDDVVKRQQAKNVKSTSKSADNAVSFEQLNEGVYKMVEEQGTSYNMMSCCTTNVELWHTNAGRKPWWDNIASMYFRDHDNADEENRSCHCRKLSKDKQRHTSTIMHWESGDCLQPAKTSNECKCPSASKEMATKPPPSMQSSTAPSSSSFITASNEKRSKPESPGSKPEGGYIQVVDETGQEAGKFFIGASGLLNNNTYEVVIQLRKKDESKEEKNVDDKIVVDHNKESDSEKNINYNANEQLSSSETDTNNVQISDKIMREVLGYRSVTDKESKMIPPQRLEQDLAMPNIVSDGVMASKATDKDQSEDNNESSDDIHLIQSTFEKKDMCDKGVHTHFTQLPKSNPLPRPATTTYTQTSLSSPSHRPVFFHMSSSTSTAYMSPPEMILPKFFRRDHCLTEDDMYDPIQSVEMSKNEFCEKYVSCICRKCMYARKETLGKINIPVHGRGNNYSNKKLRTTPNTTRSPTEHSHESDNDLKDRKSGAPQRTTRLEKPKCKHQISENIHHVKRHCNRNKRRSVESIRTNRNEKVHVGVNYTKHKPTSSGNDKKKGKSNLNPIIKDYVNKLLALNREGLKAVEVADQECSSIGTPSSSIINVPYNVDERKASVQNTISLEQIKNVLRQQIIEEHLTNDSHYSKNYVAYTANSKSNIKHCASRTSRRKPVHKVKSLNISKNLQTKKKSKAVKSKKPVSPSSTEDNIKTQVNSVPTRQQRSKSSPTPKQLYMIEPFSKYNDSESTVKNSTGTERTDDHNNRSVITVRTKSDSPPTEQNQPDFNHHFAPQLLSNLATSATSPETESTVGLAGYKHNSDIPLCMSTQTSQVNNENDTNFMKMAEDKLHNMEKIADLTEKCTKRLSNLAKVLEEVRKNKSLAYSQISSAESTDSQSDHKSDNVVTPVPLEGHVIPQTSEIISSDPVLDKANTIEKEKSDSEYISVLTDIPKPAFKTPGSIVASHPESADKLDSPLHYANTTELKSRPKPPPALSRLNFRHGQDYIIPHELSTVIEVDSPMSMKHKNQSARNDSKESSNNFNRSPADKELAEDNKNSEFVKDKESSVNPDLLQSNTNFSKRFKLTPTESSDDSKYQMIDLKQFNEIMLEPFISIQEYAKQYNMEPPDEGSNLEDIQKDDVINDDISSLHSDGSLPDVIAELLKRNIITEPFKFDTASNMNSTSVSSESTLSMLALSKIRKGRKKSVIYQNKENIGETSDTLSMSSNPDLENAFKKLGMGWASSTLKKTKERLALSSSSNTSSSSLSQFKIKSFGQDVPALITDSVSSVSKNQTKGLQIKNAADNAKNAEQQTTLSNSMTVKEFLRNELAKKITFNNKSSINDTEEEFISLFETKMPEEMKDTSQVNRDERSIESVPSGGNRARTSTPVQIFKSMTYHSSSSSNVSNGLFSNADDLSSVKMTSNSMKNHSTSDKDDLTIPNFSLKIKKSSDCSKSD